MAESTPTITQKNQPAPPTPPTEPTRYLYMDDQIVDRNSSIKPKKDDPPEPYLPLKPISWLEYH